MRHDVECDLGPIIGQLEPITMRQPRPQWSMFDSAIGWCMAISYTVFIAVLVWTVWFFLTAYR
jgi:hypothetical protein